MIDDVVMEADPMGAGSRRMRRVLFVSVAANVFLVAVILSFLASWWLGTGWLAFSGPSRSDRGPLRFERLASTLPAADGDRLRATVAARSDVIDAARAGLKDGQAAVQEALRSEPFDPQSLRVAMAELRARRARFYAALDDVIAAAAADMSPEGRRGLAEWPRRR